ncbi:MAG: 4'-phosphopantetheinyl transferase superfamily protein [Chitinophagaceae bacterium]|nr:4'-phosphopantetheinyl transferase superfamily protein [Chitinophagaceae bacterium]
MPIFFQQEIANETKLGVWKIEEPEEFFLQHVVPQRNVRNPHKRLQHLAGRFLLKYLFPDFPTQLVLIADTRKPFLDDEAYHFSISHCGNYAAALASKINRVGVDVEILSDKAEKIKNKFLSEEEWPIISRESTVSSSENQSTSPHLNDTVGEELINLSTLLWSCKEAVFKWYGRGGVDFKEDIIIKSIIAVNIKNFETIVLFKKNDSMYLNLHSAIFDEVCLSWVIT